MVQAVGIIGLAEGMLCDEERCGALPRPPEHFYIGEAGEGLDEVIHNLTPIVETLSADKPATTDAWWLRAIGTAGEVTHALGAHFKKSSLPLSLPHAEAVAMHSGFKGVVHIFGPNANEMHRGFAGTLEQYTKSLHDRLLVEQDPRLCNVFAQRAVESAQWLSIVLPSTNRRKRPNKGKKRLR